MNLAFKDGTVTGGGRDVDGRFEYVGVYDSKGQLQLTKRYIAGSSTGYVFTYNGKHDGEGVIAGVWTGCGYRGPFELRFADGRDPGNMGLARSRGRSGPASATEELQRLTRALRRD